MTNTAPLAALAVVAVLAGTSTFSSALASDAKASPCTPIAEAEFGDPVICTGTMKKGGHTLAVRLYWDILADTDEWHVTRIETAKTPNGKARTVLDDVDSRAPMTMEANGFEFGDFNFDGYTDFRLIEFLPAGPNVAYFNAIYDPKTHRHLVSTQLNMLSAPQFDAGKNRVTSEWRSNAATYGKDTYAWDGSDLILKKRVVSMYDDAQKCMATSFEPVGRVTAEALGSGETDGFLTEVYEEPCS
ncbi:MAG: hypothetical protein AAFY01_08825 [Pseudomonadota bacterium]